VLAVWLAVSLRLLLQKTLNIGFIYKYKPTLRKIYIKIPIFAKYPINDNFGRPFFPFFKKPSFLDQKLLQNPLNSDKKYP